MKQTSGYFVLITSLVDSTASQHTALLSDLGGLFSGSWSVSAPGRHGTQGLAGSGAPLVCDQDC